MKRNPWMKFYPTDWRADPALHSCTIAARGLWIEMLAIMHEAVPYGSLLVKGKRLDKKQLAGLANVPEKECVVLLLELEGMGVFERDPDGTIYSRRMRRDHARAEEGRKQVAKRWGNKGDDELPNSGPIRSPTSSDGRSPITKKPEARIDDVADDAHARPSTGNLTTPEAMQLCEKLLVIAGHDPSFWPPGWCGAPMTVQKWLNSDWRPEIIVAAVEAAAKRKIGAPASSVNYFEKAVAEEVARQAAPLPEVKIRPAETLTVTHGTSKTNRSGGSLIAAIDRQLSAIEAEERADLALPESAVLRISN